MSTCAMIQPPKMSPFWFASAGIGMTRSAGCLPSGSFSMLQIMERATAKWCETGAEDESRVGEVGIGDDALEDRGLSLLEIGSDQGVDEPFVIRPGRVLDGLALLPAVDPLAALAPELAGGDLLLEELRHLR